MAPVSTSVLWTHTRWIVLFFSHKRGHRGFQTGQIFHFMCRWILPALAMTMSHYPQHSIWASLSLPSPVCPSLRQLREGGCRAVTQCKRDGKSLFYAKFIHCCNRSTQGKYQEFVPVPVWISLELKFMKFMKAGVREMSLTWHLDLSTEQLFWVVLLDLQQQIGKPDTAKPLYILIICKRYGQQNQMIVQQNKLSCKYQPWEIDMQICLLA